MSIKQRIASMSDEKLKLAVAKLSNAIDNNLHKAKLYHKLIKLKTSMDFKYSKLITWEKYLP